MPAFEVVFEVVCGKCGAGLCNQTETRKALRGTDYITVDPCEKCLDEARYEGFAQGEQEQYDKMDKEKDALLDEIASLQSEIRELLAALNG